MKITGRKNTPLGSIGPVSVPASQEAEPAAGEPVQIGDQVELSSTQEVRQLSQMAQAMPSVRTGKVADLRGAIEDGSYYVESEKLARKVVDEALSEALLKQLRQRQS